MSIRWYYDKREFMNAITPGCLLMGFEDNQVVRVTAVGVQRFLYIDTQGKEYVSTFPSPKANWRLIVNEDSNKTPKTD